MQTSIDYKRVLPGGAGAWLVHPLVWRLTPAALLVGGLMLFSLVLHLGNLGAIGDSNPYYTAAVKSMLQSWHNFFFLAAEPGASVSVDKPPLGLWIEAGFAWGLGVSGFTTVLPNILAGVLGVPLLYHLTRRYWGTLAGLVAALVLVVTPVTFAAGRNNTMDGMLTFTLLLAAWAFVWAAENGGLGRLLLAASIVGLGFNIKMMQAFLPLPAFYALYWLGAAGSRRRKIASLALASLLLLAVSLAWAVAVDVTPAGQRPYIGSSGDNSVLGLLFGHNGLARLLGHGGPGGGPKAPGGAGGTPGRPPAGPGGPDETGMPGPLRFFQLPLAKELSWLLPLALVGLTGMAVQARPFRLPLSAAHKGLVLWGGWLLTCLAFFSVAGFFHVYYLILPAPALGAVTGGGVAALWQWRERRAWANDLLLAAAALTLAFQFSLVVGLGVNITWWMLLALEFLTLGAAGLFILSRNSASADIPRLACILMLVSLGFIPLGWSVLTVWGVADNSVLPAAYGGQAVRPPQGRDDPALLAYLQEHTGDVSYLLAAPSAQVGAPFVLRTGRPVLYVGGFNGQDRVATAADLQALVSAGRLRYVLTGGQSQPANTQADIEAWAQAACTPVPQFSRPALKLYACGAPPAGQ